MDITVLWRESLFNKLCFIALYFSHLLIKRNQHRAKKNVEKFLKTVYDWVNSLKNDNFQDYKSVSYSMRLIFKHFN